MSGTVVAAKTETRSDDERVPESDHLVVKASDQMYHEGLQMTLERLDAWAEKWLHNHDEFQAVKREDQRMQQQQQQQQQHHKARVQMLRPKLSLACLHRLKATRQQSTHRPKTALARLPRHAAARQQSTFQQMQRSNSKSIPSKRPDKQAARAARLEQCQGKGFYQHMMRQQSGFNKGKGQSEDQTKAAGGSPSHLAGFDANYLHWMQAAGGFNKGEGIPEQQRAPGSLSHLMNYDANYQHMMQAQVGFNKGKGSSPKRQAVESDYSPHYTMDYHHEMQQGSGFNKGKGLPWHHAPRALGGSLSHPGWHDANYQHMIWLGGSFNKGIGFPLSHTTLGGSPDHLHNDDNYQHMMHLGSGFKKGKGSSMSHGALGGSLSHSSSHDANYQHMMFQHRRLQQGQRSSCEQQSAGRQSQSLDGSRRELPKHPILELQILQCATTLGS